MRPVPDETPWCRSRLKRTSAQLRRACVTSCLVRGGAPLTLLGAVLLCPSPWDQSQNTCQAFTVASCLLPETKTSTKSSFRASFGDFGRPAAPILQLRNLPAPFRFMGPMLTRFTTAALGKDFSEFAVESPDAITWNQKKRKRVVKNQDGPAAKRIRAKKAEVAEQAASRPQSDKESDKESMPNPVTTAEKKLASTTDQMAAPEGLTGGKRKKRATSKESESSSQAVETDNGDMFSELATAASGAKAEKTKKPKSPRGGRKKAVTEAEPSEAARIAPPDGWKEIYDLVVALRRERDAPVDWAGSEALGIDEATQQVDKFHVLIALMLSSQTKDQVVAEAVHRLKARGLSVQSIIDMPPEELDAMIVKVGFHNNKTKYIKQTAQILKDRHAGEVPATAEELCALPGIGPKMAYIILAVAHGIVTGIGVDTHMHRIFNQLRWVHSKTPEQTRGQLEGWLPREQWGEVNVLFVGFGQMLQQPAERVKLLRRAVALPNGGEALRLVARLGGDVHTLLDKEEKDTPLMLAAREGKEEAAAALVELGADVGARNAKGERAGEMAAAHGHATLAAMLGTRGEEARGRKAGP